MEYLLYQEAQHYRLRTWRDEIGMTQVSLAKKIGVGQNWVSHMEHGKIAHTRVSTLRKYLQALGADPEISTKRPDGTRAPLDLDHDLDLPNLADA